MATEPKVDRSLDKLQPAFKNKIELLLAEIGDTIFLTETYRTKERQSRLYASGRTREGKILTQTLDSNHCKGLAVDFGFRTQPLYPAKSDPQRQKVGEVAKKYGISWGGAWTKGFTDFPHLEDGKDLPIKIIIMGYYKDLYKKEVLDPKTIKDIDKAIAVCVKPDGTVVGEELMYFIALSAERAVAVNSTIIEKQKADALKELAVEKAKALKDLAEVKAIALKELASEKAEELKD